jgi:hypothetical protein
MSFDTEMFIRPEEMFQDLGGKRSHQLPNFRLGTLTFLLVTPLLAAVLLPFAKEANVSQEKKRFTSRHTKVSSGTVVNIFRPKAKRAMLIKKLS